jgi:hypothetical protein
VMQPEKTFVALESHDIFVFPAAKEQRDKAGLQSPVGCRRQGFSFLLNADEIGSCVHSRSWASHYSLRISLVVGLVRKLIFSEIESISGPGQGPGMAAEGRAAEYLSTMARIVSAVGSKFCPHPVHPLLRGDFLPEVHPCQPLGLLI